MRPGGLYAVLRSRHINSLASQGSFTVAALRGTCFYPWRMKQVPCFTFHLLLRHYIICIIVSALSNCIVVSLL